MNNGEYQEALRKHLPKLLIGKKFREKGITYKIFSVDYESCRHGSSINIMSEMIKKK